MRRDPVWYRIPLLAILSSCLLFAGCKGGGVRIDPCKNNPWGGIEQEISHEKEYTADHDKTWNAVRTTLEQLGYSIKAEPSSKKIFTDPKEIPCVSEDGVKQIILTKWYSVVTVTVSGSKVRMGVSFHRNHLGIKKNDLTFPDNENEIIRHFFEVVDRLLGWTPAPPSGTDQPKTIKPPPVAPPPPPESISVQFRDKRENVAKKINYNAKELLLQLSTPTFTPGTIRPLDLMTQEINIIFLDPNPENKFDLTVVFVITFGDIQIPIQRKFKDQDQGRMRLTLRLRIPKDIPPGDCMVKTQVSASGIIENAEGLFRVTP